MTSISYISHYSGYACASMDFFSVRHILTMSRVFLNCGCAFFLLFKKIRAYSSTSSTGNMKNHLLAIHQISEPQQTKTTNQHILSIFSRDHHSQKAAQVKQ